MINVVRYININEPLFHGTSFIKSMTKAEPGKDGKRREPMENAGVEATEAGATEAKKVRVTMARSWGATFEQAAKEGHNQDWVQRRMLELWPDKEATILKWTTWYKNYYNMGRFTGFENPVRVNWVNERKAASAEKQAEKAERKAAEKAEKQLARAEAKKARETATAG